MKCPVCRNELRLRNFTLNSGEGVSRVCYCEHCECNYELRQEEGDKQAWWKVTKLPVIVDDSNAKYKLYMIECICTGEVVSEYPLGQFQMLRDRFANMSSSYSDGEGFELVIARVDEFDEDGMPTFEMDERVLCHQGDCGPRLHLEAARNVKRWRDVLAI